MMFNVVRCKVSRGGGQKSSSLAATSLLLRLGDSTSDPTAAPPVHELILLSGLSSTGCSVSSRLISGGFSTNPAEPLKRAKCSCTARSTSEKFKQTLCAPASQPGRGLMFLPENLSPRGNGRSDHRAEHRCIFPTSRGGSEASRTTARNTVCSSVSTCPVPACLAAIDACRLASPSIWVRSSSLSPSALSNLSSFIELMGSTQIGCTALRKLAAGNERKPSKLA
mmetsp:Transcript_27390/g.72437  ORF Transcript_27390/g.72437 Transcript_27390/m.72437 type:complete len:224 (-) Transcript_27390:1178-1849(-)